MKNRILLLCIFLLSFLLSCGGDNSTDPPKIKAGFVQIGTQIWMEKNLDIDNYNNGDIIPEVKDSATWVTTTTGAWCYYKNDPALGAIYGKLYNWYAVTDPRGLAPTGSHVPTDTEWKTLEIFLGMKQVDADKVSWRGTIEGGKLKETGTTKWITPNTGATNLIGFSAIPGGSRSNYSTFYTLNNFARWWSSTSYNESDAWRRSVTYNESTIDRYTAKKTNGFSVRCIQD